MTNNTNHQQFTTELLNPSKDKITRDSGTNIQQQTTIKDNSSEQYRLSTVYSYQLQVLYQFLKNENMYSGGFGRTAFVGESTEVIEKLLGIKMEN